MGSKPKGPKRDYRERAYRALGVGKGLVSFQVQVKETDLLIQARKNLRAPAYQAVLRYRFPMAAVAGAMAEFVGRDLLGESPEVIVENGGDLFIQLSRELKIAIFAGPSPLSMRVGLKISESAKGLGVCTSSGTVGPSLSFGRADAVCILSPSAALADAAATAVGNVVKSAGDLTTGLETAQSIEGVTGAVLIVGEKMGAWGKVELFEMKPENP
ncbi:MAG: hypothetical protein H6Q42_109 [Deltaproteobacteria bacterium]|nr:hypothetical protein [Deltaproteobacteria bacterium]